MSLNQRQHELYANLKRLADTSDTFYFKDQVLDGVTYRVFSYRLGSYSEWVLPDALECRGHMFELDANGYPVRLAAWPMQKFFNVGENPLTMDLDFANPRQVMAKMDGSLISAFMHYKPGYGDLLRLKSKTSLASQQVVDATDWLNRHENEALRLDIFELTAIGYTVNMEWISPTNRIVIGYERPELVILNVRDRMNGSYLSKNDRLLCNRRAVHQHWVETLDVSDGAAFIESVAGMQGLEGFVIELASGQWVKIKADAYCALHRSKDSANSPRRLFEVVLEGASDDLKSMFRDDPLTIRQINEMEDLVRVNMNAAVHAVETFYNENKDLGRKDYAIKGQSDLGQKYFALAMNLYLGKEADYKAWMLKNRLSFGVKDDDPEISE